MPNGRKRDAYQRAASLYQELVLQVPGDAAALTELAAVDRQARELRQSMPKGPPGKKGPGKGQ
jgi:hypothetical protein